MNCTHQEAAKKKILKNKLVYGTCKTGFGIIELLVVMFIIGIVMRVALPRLDYVMPGKRINEFIARLNTLCATGYRNALAHQKLQRLFFDMQTRTIALQEASAASSSDALDFKTIEQAYASTTFQWPETLAIQKFIVGDVDYMNKPGVRTQTTWFYIAPNGISQAVTIEFTDTSKLFGEPEKIRLSMNPLTVQFSQ